MFTSLAVATPDGTGLPLTKSEYVRRVVLEAIITGQLSPGDHITQMELADQLNMSPTPVREGLRKLDALGILTHSPHRGVRVPLPDRSIASQIYHARAALEGLIVREAVLKISDVELGQLEQIAQEMISSSVAEGFQLQDFRNFRRANYRLHSLFCEVSEMKAIQEIVSSLWARIPLKADFFTVVSHRVREATEEHAEILRATRLHDSETAGALMSKHIENAWQAYDCYLQRGEAGSTPHQSDEK